MPLDDATLREYFGPHDGAAPTSAVQSFFCDAGLTPGTARALRELEASMRAGAVEVRSPRYFGYPNQAALWPAALADALVSLHNPQLALRHHAPGLVAREAELLGELGRYLGFVAATGLFTQGGSESNHTALLHALCQAAPRFTEEGAAALPRGACLITSEQAHASWEKLAIASGLGRAAVVRVATGPDGSLRPRALQRTLDRLARQDRTPLMVAATFGTTIVGALDPVAALARLTRAAGLPLHVDAAWGGLLAFAPSHRGLADLAAADSVTLDLHKILSMPIGTSVLLLREPRAPLFPTDAAYLPGSGHEASPLEQGLPWSRRYLGARLDACLRAFGWSGLEQLASHVLELGDLLRAELADAGFASLASSPLPVVCVPAPRQVRAKAYVSAMQQAAGHEAGARVELARVQGEATLRLAICHARTRTADVTDTVQVLRRAHRRLQPQLLRKQFCAP